MNRLAALSDVHGNLPALEAVLTEIDRQGAPDITWVLGDLCLFCPWPRETLARLRELPNVSFLRGNTDRYLATGRRPAMSVRSREAWMRMSHALSVRSASFRWSVEQLNYADYEFLRDLPLQLEVEIPGFGRVLAVHGAPGDDEATILPDTPSREVAPYLANLSSRLLLYGHTHRPMDRSIDGVRLVNDGSVGLSLDGDPRPAYAILEFSGDHCEIAVHRVEYDREAVVAELARVEHPSLAWVTHILRNAALPG